MLKYLLEVSSDVSFGECLVGEALKIANIQSLEKTCVSDTAKASED